MPIYEYRCDNCHKVFEKIQRFSDEPLTVHEECGGSVHRLLSAPGLQFKGTGWYVTDYAKSGSSPAPKSSESGSKASESSKSSDSSSSSNGSTSTESKPAKKSSE